VLADRLTFALSRVHEIWIAVLACEIDRVLVSTHTSSEPRPLPMVDLCELLSLPALAEGTRKLLRMRGGERAFALLAGDELRFADVPRGALAELPEFLRALAERRALAGVLTLDGALAYRLDVEQAALLACSTSS
jgi:hypothetical protein